MKKIQIYRRRQWRKYKFIGRRQWRKYKFIEEDNEENTNL